MALVVKDRVKVTTTTTGTGTLTLGSAVNKFQDFSVIGDGNTTYYAIESSNGTDWEVGIGTYTASGTTLSRDTILESSNAGSAINLSGTSFVFCTYPAERSVNTADIGTTIQAYDADTAKYDDTTANFTGTLQNGGSNVVVDTDIGSTVQAYDADTTKNDVANTFTANQTINGDLTVDTDTLYVDSTNNNVGIGTGSPAQKLDVNGSVRLAGSTSGNITISAPSVAGTNTLTLPAVTETLATQNSLGVRNLIINGSMIIAQRATSSSGYSSGDTYLTLDRWRTNISSAGTWTMSQDTDVPSGQGFGKSMKWDCTTANGSLSAGSFINFCQYFEGQNLQHIKKGTANAESLTLSFWVKSNKTGTYLVELLDLDTASYRTINKSYSISSANTWEKKTITFAGDTTGPLDNDNARSLDLRFWLAAGTDFTSGTLQTSWDAFNNPDRAVGQVNLADSTSNYINITGVQLEIGTEATEFEHIPFDMELQRCLRYYEKSFPYTSQPAHGIDNRFVPHSGSAGCGGNTYTSERFRVEKRANPTLRIFDSNGSGTFATNLARAFISCDAGTQVSTIAFGANTTLLSGYVQGGTGVTIGFNFTADAEL